MAPWVRMLLPRLALPAILALAAALRLVNLASNPGWDGDEGYNYNIALNLAQGRHQMFALDFAFVQHPPLYFALAAGLFHLIGPGMLALRLLSIIFCLGTLALLPALARAMVDMTGGTPRAARLTSMPLSAENDMRASRRPSAVGRRPTRIGLLAALAYAVWPFAALQNRFGYTYNGLAFWTVLTLLALLRYRRAGGRLWFLLCGVAAAAALTTDQEGVYLLPVLALGLGGGVARRVGVLALALAGPALYLGVMALADRAALLFDLTHVAGRVAQGSTTFQIVSWLYNLADLMRLDPLIPLGLAGLALVPARSARRLVLGLLAAMLLVILKVRDPNPLFRTAEPLLPLVCLGLGALGAALWARLDALTRGIAPARAGALALLIAALLLVSLAGSAAVVDARGAVAGFHTPIDGLLPRSTADAEAMARRLNARLHPGDVVLAMPQVSWLLHARTAEILQAVAMTGQASAFYPAGIAPRRWVYDVRPAAARFLVADGFTDAWIAQNIPERLVVRRVERTWRLAFTQGEYRVYENPLPLSSPEARS